MKIGQVARAAGVSIDTVRFYERRGILPAPARRPSGYRVFTPAAVERIRTARALQDLGLTLDEIIDALHAHDQGDATCESERWRLEAVVERLDAKIAELQRARQAAIRALDDCQNGRCRLTAAAINDPGPRRP
ncbi:MAG TPA: MerR family transcriptional regulator [Streptosporangiaceae bacterium]|jgi:DNA-binding transcriptional MerR regulator|nr:MerR family transcriptional regulator [Streptosporangiaceae bacterium]